jgi:hypothetical protein
MEIPADKRDLRYGDWECIHPGPHQPKRLFFDYELTMILRARVRDLSGANATAQLPPRSGPNSKQDAFGG